MPSFPYDAFISHAVEDKLSVANELCIRLEQQGLKIWYSGNELRPGDSIAQRIEEGLNASRYGVVIFTPTYVSKIWALREFFALLELEKLGRKKILPILHGIKPTELAARGLEIEDRFMISTDRGMDYVVERLALQIRQPTLRIAPRRDSKVIGAITFAVVMTLLLGFYWMGSDYGITEKSPPAEQNRRINLAAYPDDGGRETLVIQSTSTAEERHRIIESVNRLLPELNLIEQEGVVVEHQTVITFDRVANDSLTRVIRSLSTTNNVRIVVAGDNTHDLESKVRGGLAESETASVRPR
jgi:hypothetical protein